MVPEAQSTHLAVIVGSDRGVDQLTARRRRDGFVGDRRSSSCWRRLLREGDFGSRWQPRYIHSFE